MSNLQDIPDPHQDWRGDRQTKSRSLMRQVYKWCLSNLGLEPLCQFCFYALRLVDRTTGIPYSADELEAKILAQSSTVGDYLEAVRVWNDETFLASGVINSPVSLELPAGDWDVEGAITFDEVAASVTARTADIGTSVEAIGMGCHNDQHSTAATQKVTLVVPRTRFQVVNPITVYLLGLATYTGVGAGIDIFGKITARRASQS